jgi:hypothetical protein
MLQINSTYLNKVAKAIVSFLPKTDFVNLHFHSRFNKLIIFNDSVWFSLDTSIDHQETDWFASIQVSDLASLSKLSKADQKNSPVILVDFVKSSFVLSSGISFNFKAEDSVAEFTPLTQVERELEYIPSNLLSLFSKVLQKQKDKNWIEIYSSGALVVGNQQITYCPFVDNYEISNIKSNNLRLSFTSTQLNNLAKITDSELGFDSNDYSCIGSIGADYLLNLGTGLNPPNFLVKLPQVEPLKSNITLANWSALSQQIYKEPRFTFKISNTKQLEKAISTAKVTDEYDLCSIDSSCIKFFQNKEVKNTVGLSVEGDISETIYLQTKHLLSALQFCDNGLTIYFVNGSQPIYCKSDLGLETIINLSRVV